MNTPQTILSRFFHHQHFRPSQLPIIESVVAGKDTLAILPTGGGKSICFQIPALLLEGVCIVVSPLIALMNDQVARLQEKKIAAAALHRGQSREEMEEVLQQAEAGELKFLYVSPERITTKLFLVALSQMKVCLLAIDEAHCVSQWGYDFRPAYLRIAELRKHLPGVPLIALTASATPTVREDIVQQLKMKQPERFVNSFYRSNLRYRLKKADATDGILVELLKKSSGSAIVYCSSRKQTHHIAQWLQLHHISAAPYHAGLTQEERNQHQEDWINDRVRVMAATNAFGMGIDKSNVRFVIHYNLPRNLEGYYQEIGRAGRDGLESAALLFFSYGDLLSYREMFEQGEASAEQKELKLAKLERMFQFAEAPVCRRKTVLNYFGEPFDGQCGNCDVCKNPPRHFDATIPAQKALSAISRTGQRVGMSLLVDILRGSNRKEILDNKYHLIKTYGAGREFSYDDWLYLLSQMLHIGLIEIAYDDHNCLRVTPEGHKVLFEGKQISLAMPEPKGKPGEKVFSSKVVEKSKTQLQREELLSRLHLLRRDLAIQHGIPPYTLFSDVTLQQMVDVRPLSDAEMLDVEGVSERKLQLYGDAFLREIRQFVLEKTRAGEKITGSTHYISYHMYQQGNTVEEIAQQRGFSPLTIMNHLATMYERGELLDISLWVSPEPCDIIQGALPMFEEPYQLKPLYEHFSERFNYDEIRWAIADFRKSAHRRP
ncbi:MAG TPA: DNA helicase RecQ [Saprospirales bacterium]|nr:DNA helicase RecQ [Saprospirales bacterium]